MYAPPHEIWPLTRQSIEARLYSAQYRGKGNRRPVPAGRRAADEARALRRPAVMFGIVALDAALLLASLLGGGAK